VLTDAEILAAQYNGFLKTASIGSIAELRGIALWNDLLDENQITSPPPAEWLTPETNILGKRMERFMHWQIEQSGLFDVVSAGLQITEEGVTIGELDFLIKERKSGVPVHLEMAYKLYLYRPDEISIDDRWTGPNLRDNLYRKIDKLKTRQFTLLQHPATKQLLKAMDLNEAVISQQLCLKTQLYLPLGNPELPKGIHPHQVAGYWIRPEQLKLYASCQFFVPKKLNWSILPEDWTEWFSYNEAEKQILQLLGEKFSPLCWIRKSNGQCQRIFVVWW